MSGVENPLLSISNIIAFDSKDYSIDKCDAWIYGIVCGWSCDETHEDPMPELAALHGWTPETVARLRRLHERYEHLMESQGK